MKSLKQFAAAVLFGALAMLGMVSSASAAIDVSAITTLIGDVQTAGVGIAVLVFVALLTFKAYRWLRSAA